ncbi:hypothetical protein EBR43_05480 [bacterium]|nr:hypothetical protein [bacterium]
MLLEIRSEHVQSLIDIASDINTSPETLDELSMNENWGVRWQVARNFNAKPETLDYLSKDEIASIRCEVASNLNTTSETLKQMAMVENHYVKYGIKYYIKNNPNCSKETYKYLCAIEILNSLTTVH